MAPTYSSEHPPKSHELYAASKVIADKCFEQNLAFFRCKDAHDHPAKCLDEGKEVHACVHETLGLIHKKASAEFTSYANCLDAYSLKMDMCRTKQLIFEAAFFSAGS